MSRPTFENIDRWLFEYTEGNLSGAQESQLLDFLELHPELMPDLKAWSNAKVKAPAHQVVSTQNLIKGVPFLLRPYALVSFAFLAILLTWLGIEMIPTAPLYVKVEIDTEIINTEAEDTDVFVDQLLAMSTNKKHAHLGSINAAHEKNTNKDILSQTIVVKDLSDSFHKSELFTTDRREVNLENVDYPNQGGGISKTLGNANWEEEVYAFDQSARAIQSNDLEKISYYLNNKEEASEQLSNDKNLAILRSSSLSSSRASKATLKKTISSTFRKLKRMAEYPIALQNTKNPHFHVPMMTGYKANFAMAGTAPGNRIQATSRMQWLNTSNSQLMNSLSWDGYVYALRGGFGIDVNYNNYKNNELNNYSAAITYSPKFSISKKVSFEPAVRFKMGVINIDQQSSSIGNTIELDRNNIIPLFKDETNISGQQLWYRDVGLGFMLNTEWFYAGFNADNIGRHDNNFYSSNLDKEYKSDIHYTAVIGTEYASKAKDFRFSGYGLFQSYGDLDELWLGTNLQYNWMQIGAAASTNLDLAASFGTIFKNISFHYNIDYTKSRLLDKQFLSHQLTMKILLKPSRQVAKFLKI